MGVFVKRSLLLSAALVPFTAGASLAACVESPTNIYVCSGSASGFTDNDPGVQVTVNSGATVSRSTGDGLRLRGLGSEVVNNGTIEGVGDNDGIDGGTGLTVTNNGTIKGGARGIDTDQLSNVTITNTGTITAVNKAIRNQNGANGKLTNSGTIFSATNEGYESGDNAVILNSGTIEAQDDAVQIGQNGKITNSGTIRSFRNLAPGAEQQDAIDIDSGEIVNEATGLIEAEANAGIDFDGSAITSTIINHGRIRGTTGVLVDKGGDDPLNENTAAQIIDNYGTIEGYDGLALDLGAGNDVLNLYAGGELIGGADFGKDDDALNIYGNLLGQVAGGAALDGNLGFDTVNFADLTLDNVLRAVFKDDIFSLRLDTGSTKYALNLRNWESYRFGDDSFDRDQILAVAPVPLPATGILLLASLGGIVLLRRRA